MIELLVLAIYAIIVVFLVVAGGVGRKTESVVGKPPLPSVLFYVGKGCVVLALAFQVVEAGFGVVRQIPVSYGAELLSLFVLCLGALILVWSLSSLGDSLRVGLPGGKTSLKVKGAYRFSRHPVYLGIFLMLLSSIIYIANVFVLIIAVCGAVIHHFIVLSEERFLRKRFGMAYIEYSKKVRRYI
jgi:protein-S-isoprenylcysteine O-methyltransferase Ste14